jgi:hypothetical protein
MMLGLRSLGYAAGALETVADSQGAAYGIYEIVEAVSPDLAYIWLHEFKYFIMYYFFVDISFIYYLKKKFFVLSL